MTYNEELIKRQEILIKEALELVTKTNDIIFRLEKVEKGLQDLIIKFEEK